MSFNRGYTARSALFALLFALIAQVAAVVPESGIYWSTSRQGEAVVVEVQNGRLSLIVYTYAPDGQPEFFVAGGAIGEGGFTEPTPWSQGYVPLHHLRADLYRSSDGPILNSTQSFPADGPAPYTATKVGRVLASFGYHGELHLQTIFEAPRSGELEYGASYRKRFNFGYHEFGERMLSPSTPCWLDLRGQWVFVDESRPQQAAWRFHFTSIEASPPLEGLVCGNGVQLITFRDESRGAEMRCVQTGNDTDPLDGRQKHHCELRLDGTAEPEFSFYLGDLGLKRVVGSAGGVPPEGVLRTEHRVIGLRVE